MWMGADGVSVLTVMNREGDSVSGRPQRGGGVAHGELTHAVCALRQTLTRTGTSGYSGLLGPP